MTKDIAGDKSALMSVQEPTSMTTSCLKFATRHNGMFSERTLLALVALVALVAGSYTPTGGGVAAYPDDVAQYNNHARSLDELSIWKPRRLPP